MAPILQWIFLTADILICHSKDSTGVLITAEFHLVEVLLLFTLAPVHWDVELATINAPVLSLLWQIKMSAVEKGFIAPLPKSI